MVTRIGIGDERHYISLSKKGLVCDKRVRMYMGELTWRKEQKDRLMVI